MEPLLFFRDPPLPQNSACAVEDLSEKLADISFQFRVRRDLSLLSSELWENERRSENGRVGYVNIVCDGGDVWRSFKIKLLKRSLMECNALGIRIWIKYVRL